MKKNNPILVKVTKVEQYSIHFEEDYFLTSEHEQDCCEAHYLSFEHLTLDDFKDLTFDLSSDTFFGKIEDYGIRLNPIKGHFIQIPGYSDNNGYYSSNLTLVLEKNGKVIEEWDITECQDY